jgi:hypothetical protein
VFPPIVEPLVLPAAEPQRQLKVLAIENLAPSRIGLARLAAGVSLLRLIIVDADAELARTCLASPESLFAVAVCWYDLPGLQLSGLPAIDLAALSDFLAMCQLAVNQLTLEDLGAALLGLAQPRRR